MPRRIHGENGESDRATTDRQWFTTTHWSAVLSAGRANSSQSFEALEKVCRSYWRPLYGYVRRLGFGPEDAQDLTQAFFARLLEKNFWARADPQKGRFRSFLLTALTQFVADQRDRARTAKRGGGASFIPLETPGGEDYVLAGLDPTLSAEQQFDRQWAVTVLEQAQAKLREECAASGKLRIFEQVSLVDDGRERGAIPTPYATLAPALGMKVGALKAAVSRLRARYGELVRQEVAQTVVAPAEVEAEIRYLLSIIGV